MTYYLDDIKHGMFLVIFERGCVWLRKKINRMVFWIAQKRFRDNKIKMIEASVMCIDPILFKHTSISTECIEQVDVILPNLMAYLVMLRELVEKAGVSSEIISLPTTVFQQQTMTLNLFFLDQDGKRSDVPTCLTEFKNLSLRCLELYQAVENEQTGIPSFNKRFLLKAINTIAKMAEQLRTYSLK